MAEAPFSFDADAFISCPPGPDDDAAMQSILLDFLGHSQVPSAFPSSRKPEAFNARSSPPPAFAGHHTKQEPSSYPYWLSDSLATANTPEQQVSTLIAIMFLRHSSWIFLNTATPQG